MDFTGYNIPAHTQRALQRYAEHGIQPGGFLTAVLSNDLFSAVACADSENLAALTDIVTFIYNRLPQDSWGDSETIRRFSQRQFFKDTENA